MNLYKLLSLSSFFSKDNSIKKFNAIIFFSLIFINVSCIKKNDSFNRYISKEKNIQFLVDQGQLHWDKRVARVFCTCFRNREEEENPGGHLTSDCRGNLKIFQDEFNSKHGM